jgi:putative ABC transport system permease protein
MNWVFWRRKRRNEELDEELQAHLLLATREEVEAGQSHSMARVAARRQFGNETLVSETTRDSWGWCWTTDLWQDIRFGLRLMGRNAGFAAIAVMTLALGIGACSTLCSIVYQTFFHPEVANDPRWEAILAFSPQRNSFSSRFSVPEYRDLLEQKQIFEAVGAITDYSGTLDRGEYPEHVAGARVSASLLPMLGTPPVLGRFFRPDEDVPGGPRVAIIDGELWKHIFNRDPNVIGRTIELDEQRYSVVGVMPDHYGVWGGGVYLPLQLEMAAADRSDRRIWVTGVLLPGVNQEKGNAALRVLAAHWRAEYSSSLPEYAGLQLGIRNGREWVLAAIRPSMLVLLGAVGFVLLISSVNLAAFLSARAMARRREMAVRMALGASRARIVRQLLVESILLSLIGGSLGVLVSAWGVPLAVALVPWDLLPNHELFHLELPAAAISLGVALLMALFFGTAPALPLSRINVVEAMKRSLSHSGTERAGRLSRNLMIVMETALALILLMGAGLLVRSYSKLMQMDLGFKPERVLSMQMRLPETRYRDALALATFYRKLLPALSAIPGVESVGATSGQPMVDRVVDRTRQDFTIVGGNDAMAQGVLSADVSVVSPGYSETMGIQLRRGREFTDADEATSPHVAVINQSLARLYWHDQDPVGQRIRLGRENPAPADPADSDAGDVVTIVGVVSDSKQLRILEAPVRPQLFVPLLQRATELRGPSLMIRSRLDPGSLTSAVRIAISSVDRTQPVYSVMTMDKIVADAFGPKRLTTVLLVLFAGLAVTLVIVGFYATLAYAVCQRTQEIGLRMALGASPRSILGMVLGGGLRLAAAGLFVGLVSSLALTRVLRSMLYNVSASDPLTMVSAIALLLVITVAACWIPARRAMRVDPMVALRNE